MTQDTRHHVVIAGGGIAGLEALIALRDLASDHVSTTLLAPMDDFVVRALSVQEPFARPSAPNHSLAAICRDHGAELRRDALQAVNAQDHWLVTESGYELTYDTLLVAVGAKVSPAYEDALTFRGLEDADAMHGVIQDVEAGILSRIAFVVPPGTTWPLPLYELALMTAERAYDMSVAVELTIVTPESRPLAIFGQPASERVAAMLAERGIILRTDCHVSTVEGRTVIAAPGDVAVRAQRIVALPRLTGPRLRGLPCDTDGFLPVDEFARVRGEQAVFGAGDGTTVPIKQGGVAAQQAGAAARSIAARAGADVQPERFRPVLRAELLTGARSTYLSEAIAGGAGEQSSTASDDALWWPASKVATPYLAPYLEAVERGAPAPVVMS